MARYGNDYRHRGVGDHGHFDYGQRGYMMDPGYGWDDGGRDPNYAGGTYHGMRMNPGSYQAAYGRYRLNHQVALGGHGGFDGRHDQPNGFYDRGGIYHEAREQQGRMGPGRLRYDVEHNPRWENGGQQYGSDYLRQYNANSPAQRFGGPDRSWGFAPGSDQPRMLGRDGRGRPTEEHRHNGYNTGGFAEGHFRGPGTRNSNPNR